jgi:hypothetical protein
LWNVTTIHAFTPEVQKKLLTLLMFCSLSSTALCQTKPASPLCTQDNALDMIRQQVELAKTFNTTQRIATLIRVADLLWPYQQDKARAAFAVAFEIAAASEVDAVDAPERPRSVLLRLRVPDQRYLVIRAVARRDLAWVRALIQQVAKQDEAATSREKVSFNKQLTGERLIQTANQLLAIDMNAALELARTSLNYPASMRASICSGFTCRGRSRRVRFASWGRSILTRRCSRAAR